MPDTAGALSNTTLGKYRIGPLLGSGGMGEVYRAEDLDLHRAVALKVLPHALVADPDRRSRFVQEARTASALNHPHLVSIYDVGEQSSGDGGRPVHYIAMELVAGETLRQIIAARRTDLRKLLDYLAQAAEALAAAHAAGIVHRDLKPENLMVADGGYVKVLDFGIAKLKGPEALPHVEGDTQTVAALTTPGLVMGTSGYMSPEQAQGRPVDARSDIFSFGCVLYEAVTGARPFQGDSVIETLHRIVNEPPRSMTAIVPGLPGELQRIVRKCLAKDPDERYQSMKDVAIDLRELRRELDTGATRQVTTAPSAFGSRGRRPRLIVPLALLAVVAVAAVSLWMVRAGRDRARTAPISIERITTTGNVIDAVMSPDAKYLAYVESSRGRQTLFVRQLTGSRPLLLTSYENGGFWGIAFSKDATNIYYAVKGASDPTGTLYSVPILGGTPRQLLSDIDSGVTFSPDGSRIAYYRVEASERGASSLVIAGADGSNPQPLVTKRPPEFFAPAFFATPSWSPDGTRIACAIRSSATRDARLATIGVQDRAEMAFPPRYVEATFTTWIPDGSGIVFVARPVGLLNTGNGGPLFLQPYPAGEVQRITSDLIEYRNATVSSDGRSLVTVGFEVSGRLSVVTLGTSEERPIPSERYDGASGIAWSPDGSRLFFTRMVRNQTQIWSRAIEDSAPREVITSQARFGSLEVSRDGTLVFASERDGLVQLWRAAMDGSGARPIAAVPDPNWTTIAPDGQTVYFTSSMQGSPSTFRVPMTGGKPVLVAPLLERARVSPDGRFLAGVFHERPGAPISLGVVDVSTGKPVHNFPDFTAPSGGGGIAWSADGRSLIFTTTERANLWKRPLAGGEPEKITNFSDFAILRFALSPDGTRALLFRGSMLRDAFLITNFR